MAYAFPQNADPAYVAYAREKIRLVAEDTWLLDLITPMGLEERKQLKKNVEKIFDTRCEPFDYGGSRSNIALAFIQGQWVKILSDIETMFPNLDARQNRQLAEVAKEELRETFAAAAMG